MNPIEKILDSIVPYYRVEINPNTTYEGCKVIEIKGYFLTNRSLIRKLEGFAYSEGKRN